MFREFLIPVYDYFSISKKYLFFDFGIPFIVSVLIYVFSSNVVIFNNDILGQQITLLGIIAGFNITALSVLTTADNATIDKLKGKFGENRLNGKKIDLFQELYIFISYSILMSFFIIFFCFIGYIISVKEISTKNFFDFLCYSNLILIFHCIFLNIRNIAFIYFSFFKN
jgi:hypothetical protein